MKHKRTFISIAMATIVLVSLCAVGASASAAQDSKASVEATPKLVGSPIAAGTGPAACKLNGTNNLYVFVEGHDGALWYRIMNTMTDAWTTNWTSLGGVLTSSPAAVSRTAGFIDVYVAGLNGTVYGKACWLGHWQASWTSLGGKVAPGTGPAASGWTGREDVFIEGTNSSLYQKTWTAASGWSKNWVSLGGKLTSSPAVTSPAKGVIDVCVRGTDGAVWWGVVEETWSGYFSLRGSVALNTGPTVCSYGGTLVTARFDVFAQRTNGALYQMTGTELGGWSFNWQSLGGVLTSSPTAATTTYNGRIDIYVFSCGTGGLLYYTEYYTPINGVASWHAWVGPIQGPA